MIRRNLLATDILNLPAVATRDLVLKASCEVCSIIAEITPKLGREDSASSTIAEGFLKRLRNWTATLPVEMRHFSRNIDQPLTPDEQERTIGNVHLSCAYYFAVMLVTRPFLISYLMEQMSSGINSTPHEDVSMTESSDLAQACIDAAMMMAKMCCEALQSDILLKQMCVLK